MFTNGFIKTAETINMVQTSPGVYKPKINKLQIKPKHLAAAGAFAGGAYLYNKHKKQASDMKMGPPKGKKETPEQKKIREQAEITSLGC